MYRPLLSFVVDMVRGKIGGYAKEFNEKDCKKYGLNVTAKHPD